MSSGFSQPNGPLVRLAELKWPVRWDDRAKQVSAYGAQPTGLIAAKGSAGTLALAVRDFRQLFPKELALDATHLSFHMWPAHGLAPRHRVVDDATIQSLWYCHEGEVLDFQAPEDYHTHTGEHSEYTYRYLRSSKSANAIGLAKTHELLVLFTPNDADPGLPDRLNTTFQAPPVCMAAPEWMCSSGLFGSIQPYSPDRFDAYEHLMSGTFDAEQRMQAHTRDYGMWNYGDDGTEGDSARSIQTQHGIPTQPKGPGYAGAEDCRYCPCH